MRAFIFPGQGSQSVGMGKALYDTFPEAKEVFQEIDDVLSQKLSQLIFEGPIEALTLTENTQPALMAVSLATWRVLEKQGGKNLRAHAAFVAGHSLGEYSALAVAGSFTLADTARLLRTRGKAMQEAVPAGQGAMAAVIGVTIEQADAIAKQAGQGGEPIQIANDNSEGQVVLSGSTGAIDMAESIAKEAGAKRYLKLPVSAPFHSTLMQPAAAVMQAALAKVHVNPPTVPLIANITADSVQEPDTIRRLLVEQVTGRVRWRESMQTLAARGVTEVVELGAGKVLTGLAKRCVETMQARAIGSPEDIEAFLKG